jgi:hypothetical protein
MAPKNINNSPTGIYPSLVSAQILANQPDLFEPKKSSKRLVNIEANSHIYLPSFQHKESKAENVAGPVKVD